MPVWDVYEREEEEKEKEGGRGEKKMDGKKNENRKGRKQPKSVW